MVSVTANATCVIFTAINCCYVVAVGYFAAVVKVSANATCIIFAANYSCVVAVGYCASFFNPSANATCIFFSTSNRCYVVAIGYCAIAFSITANTSNFCLTTKVRINNTYVFNCCFFDNSKQTNIIFIISQIQTAYGMVVAIEST